MIAPGNAVTDDHILLMGVTGSTAYGMATESSDIDRLGVHQARNRELLGLTRPLETFTTTAPDSTTHELGKFVRLAVKANPTILELLYLDAYEKIHPAGRLLIDNRDLFLSQVVLQSYGGYVMSQVRRLQARGDSFGPDTRNRYAKHARHIFRLLQQGQSLLENGSIDVKVRNREELFEIGALPPALVVARFEAEFERFQATPHSLPEAPDLAAIDNLLIHIRETWG